MRTPGGSAYGASSVHCNGYGVNYDSVYYADVAVRPALHINLSSSNLWSYAGTVSSEGGSQVNGNIIGQIKGFDASDRRVKINDTTYSISNDISDEDIQSVMSESTESMVAAYLDNGVITSIRPLQDILKPVISIEPDISEIVYENSKFSKTKFKLKVTIKCDVKPSYSLEQVQAALPSDSKLGIHISKVNNTTVFTASVNDDKSTEIRKTINITNMDMSRKNAAAKQYVRDNSSEMNTINTILNSSQAAFDDTKLREVLTDNEVKAVTAQVNNWIYTSNSLYSILMSESDNDMISKFVKDSGIYSPKLAQKVLEKLGISQVVPGAKTYKGTLKFEAKDKNTNKDVVIVFTMSTSFYNIGSSEAYGGFGTINYTVKKSGGNIKSGKSDIGGVGMSTYTNYDKFAASLEKILERQIHNCYSKIYGKGIDEISDEMIQGTFGKIVNEKYGSASEMVYTGLKYACTGYTEEDAKKSVKDVIIILTKDSVAKKTKVSVHCPVDLSVYDGDGNLCAQIVNNQVIAGYDDIMIYADNDDKYIMLPDEGDYVVEYTGNDTGTMSCTIEKYEGEEVVKSIDYKDIPLSKDKKYSNFFADKGTQGVALYNLNCEDGTEITPASLTGFERQEIKAEKLSVDKNNLELKTGDSYVLNEVFEPYNVSDDSVTWESSDEKVAAVDDIGTVTAVAAGEAEITVKDSTGNLSDKCKVVVKEADITTSPQPTATADATASPTKTPTALPTESASPKLTATAKVTASPTTIPSVSTSPNASTTPTITEQPTKQPAPTTPSVTKQPTAAPTKTPSKAVKVKKGTVIKDKKTKASYKVLSVKAGALTKE